MRLSTSTVPPLPSTSLLVLWLLLGTLIISASAADEAEGWQTQIRGVGTKRAVRSGSQSGGSSKSKSKPTGTGKSKPSKPADTSAGTAFPKYFAATTDPIPGQYIVTYKNMDKMASMTASSMDDMSDDLCRSKNGKLMGTYHKVLQGFTAQLTKEAAMEISQIDMVEFVEEDSLMHADAVGSWGLDRIDQRDKPLDMSYSPLNMDGSSSNRGQGVTVYIVDTGIKKKHDEWWPERRYAGGMNFVGDGINWDCNGHGTHVAGTVGGKTYGVANQVRLFAIKVLGCNGSGSYSGVINALDWIATNAAKPAVANLSLGGGKYVAVNTAINNLVDSGVVVTVSAGNGNIDSCTRSPASADKAITVGSTTQTDARSSFSNYGPCVDIFAPGSSIKSAWRGRATDATNTISGTSMSAPHVAGLAALYLGENPNLSPLEVTRKMLQYDATYEAITSIPGDETANLLAYTGPNACSSESDGSSCTLPNQCKGTCQGGVCSLPPGKFSVAIKVDSKPKQISWKLLKSSTVVASRDIDFYKSNKGPLFCDQVDIVQGTSYLFEIKDSGKDALCCDHGHGYYSIYDGNIHLTTGDEFGSSDVKSFTAQTGGGIPSPQPVVIFSNSFETGWNGWTDGGVDAARISWASNVRTGQYALRLQGNTAESTVTKGVKVQPYSTITVDFYFKPRRMTASTESFHLDVKKDDGMFLKIAEWKPKDMTNGKWNRGKVQFDVASTSNVIIRFRCVGDTSNDTVFLDDITVIGE